MQVNDYPGFNADCVLMTHQSLGHYSLKVDVKQSRGEQALEDSSSVLEVDNISAELFVLFDQVGGEAMIDYVLTIWNKI